MMEITGLLLGILFLTVAYFAGKIGQDKSVKDTYSIELKYILEDVSDIKKNIFLLKKETSNKGIKEDLKQLKLKIEHKVEKDINNFLLEISNINEGNSYKYSTKLHHLKEEITYIEEYLLDIEDSISKD